MGFTCRYIPHSIYWLVQANQVLPLLCGCRQCVTVVSRPEIISIWIIRLFGNQRVKSYTHCPQNEKICTTHAHTCEAYSRDSAMSRYVGFRSSASIIVWCILYRQYNTGWRVRSHTVQSQSCSQANDMRLWASLPCKLNVLTAPKGQKALHTHLIKSCNQRLLQRLQVH